jgi:hypothetical protein
MSRSPCRTRHSYRVHHFAYLPLDSPLLGGLCQYRNEATRDRGSILYRGKRFLFPPQRPPSLPFNEHLGSYAAHRSFPPRVKVKNAWSYTSIPLTPSRRDTRLRTWGSWNSPNCRTSGRASCHVAVTAWEHGWTGRDLEGACRGLIEATPYILSAETKEANERCQLQQRTEMWTQQIPNINARMTTRALPAENKEERFGAEIWTPDNFCDM